MVLDRAVGSIICWCLHAHGYYSNVMYRVWELCRRNWSCSWNWDGGDGDVVVDEKLNHVLRGRMVCRLRSSVVFVRNKGGGDCWLKWQRVWWRDGWWWCWLEFCFEQIWILFWTIFNRNPHQPSSPLPIFNHPQPPNPNHRPVFTNLLYRIDFCSLGLNTITHTIFSGVK